MCQDPRVYLHGVRFSGLFFFFPERRQVFLSHSHAGGMFSQSAVSVWSIRTIWARSILHFWVCLSFQITPHPTPSHSPQSTRFDAFSHTPAPHPQPPTLQKEREKKERIEVFFNTALSKQACFLSPPTPAPVGVVLPLKTLFNTRSLR